MLCERHANDALARLRRTVPVIWGEPLQEGAPQYSGAQDEPWKTGAPEVEGELVRARAPTLASESIR